MRRHTVFRILTLVYLAAVAALCFGNFQNSNQVSWTLFGIHADKVIHFCMFFPFPVLTFFSLKLNEPRILIVLLSIVGIFALGCLIAWGTEYVQGLLPYRTMDPADFAADRLGLICGSLMAFLLAVLVKSRKDA